MTSDREAARRRGPVRRRRRPFGRRDDGSMAVEVVLMAPILVLFMLFVVALGRMVWIRGQLESAARDAVRAASLERDRGTAESKADAVVLNQTDDNCQSGGLEPGSFAPGATITYTMSCQISFSELGLLGLPGSTTVTFSSDAPLDEFRRSG